MSSKESALALSYSFQRFPIIELEDVVSTALHVKWPYLVECHLTTQQSNEIGKMEMKCVA